MAGNFNLCTFILYTSISIILVTGLQKRRWKTQTCAYTELFYAVNGVGSKKYEYHQTLGNFTLSSDLRYKLTLVKELGECRWHWITVLWLKQYWLLPLPKSSLLWDTVLSGGWFQFVSWKYQPSSRLDCSSEYYRELQVSFAQKPQTCLHAPLWYNIWTERERVWHHRNVNVCQRFGCRIMHNILLHFWKTREFRNPKAKWHLSFSLLSIILADLLGNRTLL